MQLNCQDIYGKLINGNVVGVPTDTVYGLASLKNSIDQLYIIKKRDKSKKIVQFIASCNQLDVKDQKLINKMHQVWPGNVTLIFNYHNEMTSFRIPDEDNILSLLNLLNEPLFVTSANLSGLPEITTKEEFELVFPNIPLLKEDIKTKKSNKPSKIYQYKNEFERLR